MNLGFHHRGTETQLKQSKIFVELCLCVSVVKRGFVKCSKLFRPRAVSRPKTKPPDFQLKSGATGLFLVKSSHSALSKGTPCRRPWSCCPSITKPNTFPASS